MWRSPRAARTTRRASRRASRTTCAPFATIRCGQILVEPVGDYTIPAEFGPLVTDPGMTAHVLRLDQAILPQQPVHVDLAFRNLGDTGACLKGLDVRLATRNPGGHRVLVPTEGLGLDFTAIPGPGVHRVCIGPDTTTASVGVSWGRVKSTYR